MQGQLLLLSIIGAITFVCASNPYMSSIAPILMTDYDHRVFIYYEGNHPNGRSRTKRVEWHKARAVDKKYLVVDMLYVLDHSVYARFLQIHANHAHNAIHTLANYFNVLAYEVDRIANEQLKIDGRTRFVVNPIGLYIARNESDSPWRTAQASANGSHGDIQSVKALEDLQKWIHENKANLPAHDHAVAITRLELVNRDGSKNVEGVAWPESICSTYGYSVSVVEDVALPRTVWSVVHELTHSLGADHGGKKYTCRFEDFTPRKKKARQTVIDFSRSWSEEESAESNELHPTGALTWKKSHSVVHPIEDDNNLFPDNYHMANQFATHRMHKCAIKQVAKHIRAKPSYTSCLRQTTADWSGSLRDVTFVSDLPGQVFDADKQCQLLMGHDYRFCRVIHGLNGRGESGMFRETKLLFTSMTPQICLQHRRWYASHLCQRLFCVHKNDVSNRSVECSSVWSHVPALYATSCGHQKWCHDGRCIVDLRAPAIDQSFCKSGQEDPVYCSETVPKNPFMCELFSIRKFCCRTCEKMQKHRNRRHKLRTYQIVNNEVEYF